MSYLLDTNVLSELRKRARANPHVVRFTEVAGWDNIHTSWIVIAEMRRGAALVYRRDPTQAKALDAWIAYILEELGDRIHPVEQRVADRWAQLMVPDPRSPMDALIAATASAHGFTLVTRDVRDFAGAGIDLLDPWTYNG